MLPCETALLRNCTDSYRISQLELPDCLSMKFIVILGACPQPSKLYPSSNSAISVLPSLETDIPLLTQSKGCLATWPLHTEESHHSHIQNRSIGKVLETGSVARSKTLEAKPQKLLCSGQPTLCPQSAAADHPAPAFPFVSASSSIPHLWATLSQSATAADSSTPPAQIPTLPAD